MKLPAIFQKIKKEQTPEEKKKEAIFRTGTRQLKKLFQMGIGFPIIAMKM